MSAIGLHPVLCGTTSESSWEVVTEGLSYLADEFDLVSFNILDC